MQFATDAPGYGQLQSDEVIASLNQAFFGSGGCQEQEMACYAAGEDANSNTICSQADNFCVSTSSFDHMTGWTNVLQIDNVFAPAVGNRDSDDLRQTAPGSFPPEFYVTFLRNATITKLIGSEVRVIVYN